MGKVETIAIVGGGLAGAKAAEALRKDGFDGRVLLFGAEAHRPYIRPPLSKEYLRGEGELDKVFVHPEAWYAEQRVDLEPSTTVTAIDAASHEVVLDGGRRVGFDRLVIATGSEPTRLDVPGGDLAGIRYLRTLDDSDGLRDAAGAATQVVVIGSGWIGAEVAASIRQLGREVALVADTSVPLERVLGTEVGAIFGDVHAASRRSPGAEPARRGHPRPGRRGRCGRDGRRHPDRRGPGRRRHRSHAADRARRGRRARRWTTGSWSTSTSSRALPASSPPATSPTPCTRSPGRGSASSTGTTRAARAVSRAATRWATTRRTRGCRTSTRTSSTSAWSTRASRSPSTGSSTAAIPRAASSSRSGWGTVASSPA